MTLSLDLILTLVAGSAVLAASAALGLWQILSAPDRPNYPTSGRVKRTLMFVFMMALAYRGLEILTLAGEGTALPSPKASASVAVLMAALFVTFLVDHIRHWLPARTHQRIRQLLAIATCRPDRDLVAARDSAMEASTGKAAPPADVVGPALAALTLQGVRLAGPKEGPEALN